MRDHTDRDDLCIEATSASRLCVDCTGVKCSSHARAAARGYGLTLTGSMENPKSIAPAHARPGRFVLPVNSAAKRPPWSTLIALLVGHFVVLLNTYTLGFLLSDGSRQRPELGEDLYVLMTTYLVGYGLCLLISARLGDLLGYRCLFLAGLGLFTLASALGCFAANTMEEILASQALLGIGAGMVAPQTWTSLRVLSTGDLRRQIVALALVVDGSAYLIGGMLGAVLIALNQNAFGWRLMLFMDLLLGLVALLVGWRCVPTLRSRACGRLDLHGAVVGTLGLALILIPLAGGPLRAWPWWSLAGPPLALVVLAYFAHHENKLSRSAHIPIVDVKTFGNRAFIATLGGAFLFYIGAGTFASSLMLLSEFALGGDNLPLSTISTLVAIGMIGGSLAGRPFAAGHGRLVLLAGVIIFASGAAILSVMALTEAENYAWLRASFVFIGAGPGLVYTRAIDALLEMTLDDQASTASAAILVFPVIGIYVVWALIDVTLSLAVESTDQAAGPDIVALAPAIFLSITALLTSLMLFTIGTRR